MLDENESKILNPLHSLQGGGEMGQRTREYDWSTTVIGSFDNWSQSLRTTVGIILRSDFPMFLWWGDNLIQFYNDAYRRSLGENGKHPRALGQKGKDCWPEAWHIIYPLIHQVGTTGESFFIDDKMVPIFRNGKIEEVYWTFSYSTVIDDNGKIEGVLVVCNETTKKVGMVNELERSKEGLAVSSAHLHRTILRAPVAVCLLEGPHHVVAIANDRMIELWGKTHDEVIGKPLFEGLPEARDQGFEQLLDGVYSTSKTYTANEVPVTLPRAGGIEVVYVNFVYEAQKDIDGTISGIMAVAVEVTEQVLARRKIEHSESRFRSLVSSAPVAIALFVGPDLIVEMPNKAFNEILGKDYDLTGKPLAEVMPEIKAQPFLKILQDVYATGKPFHTNGTQVNIVKNGKMDEGFYDFSYTPLFNADGEVYAILDIAVEVTEQIISKRKIEASERENQKLVAMMQATHDFVGLSNTDSSVSFLNPAALNMLGWDSFHERSITDAIYSEDLELANKLMEELSLTGSFVHDIRLVNEKTKEFFWVLWNAFTVRDFKTGEVTGFATVSPNITERKKIELQLKESEERFRILADQSPMMVFIIEPNPEATISYWNKTWLEYTGQTLTQALGRAWEEVVHPDDLRVLLEIYIPAFSQRVSYSMPSIRLRRYDGVYRWYLFKGNPRFLPNGEFMGFIGVAIDIHEQKLAEFAIKEHKEILEKVVTERTYQLERSNQDLQQFAHVISHDLKEPVRKIKTFAYRLEDEAAEKISPKEKEYINKIISAANRMSTMVDGVLIFSTMNSLSQKNEWIDLNKIFEAIELDLEVLIAQKSARIEVKEMPFLEGAEVLIYQLFYNLMNNSLKFAEPGRPPVITVTSESRPEKLSHVTIYVKDNGIGFDQRYASKIFDTFARLHSKDRFEGTGLGLALCKKIVERHNGSIQAEGTVGIGTTFVIELPLYQLKKTI